ncbi:MAG: hypothetical protein AAF533_18265 [Acidobacteriota bacterium]
MMRTLAPASWTILWLAASCLTSPSMASDLLPPTLVGLDAPAVVDVRGDNATFDVHLELADDLSGLARYTLWLHSPGEPLLSARGLSIGPRDSEIASFELFRYSPAGAWTFELLVEDQADNALRLGPDQLAELGFPSGLEVLSEPDVRAPELLDLQIWPELVDVRGGPATVTLWMELSDDLSGIHDGSGILRGPIRWVQGTTFERDATTLHGTYRWDLEIVEHDQEGRRSLSLDFIDVAGNVLELDATALAALGFPSGFDVVSEPDVTPPELLDLTLSETDVEVSEGDVEILLRLEMSDDLSGYWGGFAYLEHPTSGSSIRIPIQDSSAPRHVVLERVVTIPQFSHSGDWRLRLYGRDVVRNYFYPNAETLETLGFPSTVRVTCTKETPQADEPDRGSRSRRFLDRRDPGERGGFRR